MMHGFLRNFAVLLVVVACTKTVISQQLPQRVVANRAMAYDEKSSKKNNRTTFALKGDTLTVDKVEGEFMTVLNSKGNQAKVPKGYVTPLAKAQPIFTEMIDKKPKEGWLYVARAGAWEAAGEHEKAIADYNRAMQQGLKSPSVWINRGATHTAMREYDKAISDFTTAIQQGAQGTNALLNRGIARVTKGDYDAAIVDLDGVLKVEPKNVLALYQRGLARQRKKQWDQAITDFTAVLKHDKQHLSALSGRAYTLFLQGKHEAAVGAFTEVIKLNPEAGLAYNNRGFNRQVLGDYQGAVEDYAEAIRLSPKYALAFQNMAWLLSTCPEEAIRDGKRALKAARQACELREWKAPSDIKALAAAHAETRRFQRSRQATAEGHRDDRRRRPQRRGGDVEAVSGEAAVSVHPRGLSSPPAPGRPRPSQ